jgi:hypothetical protein
VIGWGQALRPTAPAGPRQARRGGLRHGEDPPPRPRRRPGPTSAGPAAVWWPRGGPVAPPPDAARALRHRADGAAVLAGDPSRVAPLVHDPRRVTDQHPRGGPTCRMLSGRRASRPASASPSARPHQSWQPSGGGLPAAFRHGPAGRACGHTAPAAPIGQHPVAGLRTRASGGQPPPHVGPGGEATREGARQRLGRGRARSCRRGLERSQGAVRRRCVRHQDTRGAVWLPL